MLAVSCKSELELTDVANVEDTKWRIVVKKVRDQPTKKTKDALCQRN